MIRTHHLAALVLGYSALLSPAAQFKAGPYTLTVPDGFTVETIASSPLVDRPIVADLDHRGRLYVADSSGSNENVQRQLIERPHRIVRLEDLNGDGIFDTNTVFADKMMFPEGTMWHDGSLYVSAPPSIWKLTDTNNDGVADKREEWFKGTLTGCANDLHGPYLGPDGWIYWAKGAFAKQSHEYPGRKPFVTRAAHIFRAPVSGLPIEPVMTGGMDNPVDVVFTPEGDRIFTTTFLQNPQGGKRDGLIHAVYGGVYGKVHDVIDDHPRTGDVLPVLTHLGPAAPSGLVAYKSGVFGEAYRNNLFAALFNMHKVTRHVLEPVGATYRTVDSDFLTCDDPDFHPTDVFEDADGSLIVIDTGGWYKLCCPTSQLAKPDVLGAIYRIRKTGAPEVEDPHGAKLAWSRFTTAQLLSMLNPQRESRWKVRERAIQALAGQRSAAVPGLVAAMKSERSVETRRNIVWALCRIDSPAAREATRAAILDSDPGVARVAFHAVSLWRDTAALDPLLSALRSSEPAVRRITAEALGRIGDKRAVAPLLEASRGTHDRMLEHAITFALIEIADPSSTATGLHATDINTRRTALIALDQMPNGNLQPAQVMPLLSAAAPLAGSAQWVLSRHPEWGEAMAGHFRERLAQGSTGNDLSSLETLLAQFGRNTAVQALLASSVNDRALAKQSRFIALGAMARSGLRELPESWQVELTRLLASNDSALVTEAVTTLRSLPAPKKSTADLSAALTRVASNTALPTDIRLDALAAVPGSIASLDPAVFDFLRSHVSSDHPVRTRSAAASVLARARLTEPQLRELINSLDNVGPMELPKVLSAYQHGTSETLGTELVTALAKSPAVSVLRSDVLNPAFKNYPKSVRARADELLNSLHQDLPKQREHLDTLLARVKEQKGDVRRGQTLFASAQTSCSACHAIGYLGGNLGPDLTSVGTIRTERDLLESIVYPSASFVRSYEPISVTTSDGETYSGILRHDAKDEVLLATGPGAEIRLARDNITAMQPGTVSIMPGGLHEQLTTQQLADLLAFLKNTKWGAK